MQLGKLYKIESDALNITLYKRRVNGDKESVNYKKVYWDIGGYYSTIENALEGMKQYHIKESAMKDMETIMEAIREVDKLIRKVKKGEE